MKFGSVCSGIEAASVAWGPLGWQAAWFSEIEPFASAVLAHHYPETPNLGDMTRIPALLEAGEVDAPDILCGGTPCQGFSVAGLRKSLDDARGNLSLTFCEIANAIDSVRARGNADPCIVFWENVPGVLSTKDNAFGCFLAGLAGEDVPLEPPGGKWTDAGVVLGPARAIAWRILDAQYFGLAQRRRRVFVVASAREGFDPAAVLLEFEGVRRDSAPSREAGKGSSTGDSPSFGIRSANTSINGWGVQRELTHTLDTASPQIVAQAFSGNRTSGPIDVAPALNACGTASGRQDFETEAFITTTHTLRGEGFDASKDGTGRGTPLVPVNFQASQSGVRVNDTVGTLDANYGSRRHNGVLAFDTYNQTASDTAQTLCSRGDTPGGNAHLVPAVLAHAFDARQSDVIQYGDKTITGDVAATLGTGSGSGVAAGPSVMQPVAFDTTQVTSALNRSNPKPGDPCHPLLAGAHAPAVAFQPGNLSRGAGSPPSAEVFPTLKSDHGRGLSDQQPHVMAAMQVRRLTPVECERLQGFPDGYTAIPWRGKPADQCHDGPRYKALGNSWAVPVVRWIGARIHCLSTIV